MEAKRETQKKVLNRLNRETRCETVKRNFLVSTDSHRAFIIINADQIDSRIFSDDMDKCALGRILFCFHGRKAFHCV